MKQSGLPEDFYEKIKPRLHERTGRELRVAHRVLDIACGNCGLGAFLRKTYCQRVTGIDIRQDRFPKRSSRRSRSPFRCIKADGTRLTFLADRSIDGAVMKWALHEMNDPLGVLREAYRVLRPGGKILIIEFPRGSLASRLWKEKYFTPLQIERMLKEAGFHEIRGRTIERGQVLWTVGYRRSNGNEKE
jgi:ubiquinone/menaquinone biosynthesis C-methylase UbiE